MEQIEIHLRDEMSSDERQVEWQLNGYPAQDSLANIFIAISDKGTSNIATSSDQFWSEDLSMEASLWVRASAFPTDLKQVAVKWTDPYRIGVVTLDQLMLDVRAALASGMSDTSGQWKLVKRINDIIESDCNVYGWNVLTPLRFLDASDPEEYTDPHATEGHFESGRPSWIGRRLRFSGLRRTQGFATAR